MFVLPAATPQMPGTSGTDQYGLEDELEEEVKSKLLQEGGGSVDSKAKLDNLVGENANMSAGGSAFLPIANGGITPGMFSVG